LARTKTLVPYIHQQTGYIGTNLRLKINNSISSQTHDPSTISIHQKLTILSHPTTKKKRFKKKNKMSPPPVELNPLKRVVRTKRNKKKSFKSTRGRSSLEAIKLIWRQSQNHTCSHLDTVGARGFRCWFRNGKLAVLKHARATLNLQLKVDTLN